MTARKTQSSLPHLVHDSPSVEQAALDQRNRRSMAALVVELAVDADDLVTLASALEVDVELDELAGNVPERQQRLAAARQRLAETVGVPVEAAEAVDE